MRNMHKATVDGYHFETINTYQNPVEKEVPKVSTNGSQERVKSEGEFSWILNSGSSGSRKKLPLEGIESEANAIL